MAVTSELKSSIVVKVLITEGLVTVGLTAMTEVSTTGFSVRYEAVNPSMTVFSTISTYLVPIHGEALDLANRSEASRAVSVVENSLILVWSTVERGRGAVFVYQREKKPRKTRGEQNLAGRVQSHHS
jgi:hypothetical protein